MTKRPVVNRLRVSSLRVMASRITDAMLVSAR